MRSSSLAVTRLFFVIESIAIPTLHAADSASADVERKFSQSVRPFLATYCIGCHSGATPAAQMDRMGVKLDKFGDANTRLQNL